MKNKKLFLPAIILVVAILATVVYSLISSIAFKPAITEGEFPFSITYEMDGETFVIKDVYKAEYEGNGGYADTMHRNYNGTIIGLGEQSTIYTVKRENNTRIELNTFFYADYMMGDTEYDYFDEEPFEPRFYYYDANEQEYHDEETLAAHGVKMISFEYPEPIKNSFSFSHISYCSGAVVLPSLLIAILALLAIMIFVKKEKELEYKAAHIISIVFNFIIGIICVPIVTILGVLIDIEGGGPELYYQIMYFIPALSVLSLAASVALRRKGYGKSALIASFIGPVIFGLYLLICYVGGLV